MSGGALFQSRVIADVSVYIVSQRPLPWFGTVGRIPTAVWGESHGPGDDLRIEFEAGPAAEAQAKHSMGGGQELRDVVDGIVDRSSGSPTTVALVVGSPTGSLRQVGRDLERLRAGRDDGLSPDLESLISDPARRAATEQLYLVTADLDDPHSPGRTAAIERLRARLVDPSQAEAAWDLLVADAADASAKESRRDAEYLGTLLAARGIQLKPPARDEPWLNRLQWIQHQLIDTRHDLAALDSLQQLDHEVANVDVSPVVRARSARLRAIALIRLDRSSEALTAAQETVRLTPDWSDGLATASQAALVAGELALADEYADRALAAPDANERAWSAKLLAVDQSGREMPEVPQAVQQTSRFRGALLDVAQRHGDHAGILELTAQLVRGPEATPEARFIRAQALRFAGDTADGATGRENWLEAEALLTEVLQSVHPLHPLVAPSYLIRSQVRSRLGRTIEAEADLVEAERSNFNDPELIHQAAAMRAGRGDLKGALALLRNPVVDDAPTLRAMRAEILVGVGEPAAAKEEISEAMSSVAPGPDADLVFLQLAGAAVRLRDVDLAEELRHKMTVAAQEDAPGLLLAGEIAFARGEIDRGVEIHRRAAEVNPRHQTAILMRLGLELHGSGRPDDALAIFNEVGLDAIEPPGLQAYAQAAYAAGDLAATQAAIERLSDRPLPEWALALEADIALRRDAPDVAAQHLAELEARGVATARVYLALARCLVELGREDEALTQVRAAVDADPTPSERVQAAVFLKELGEPVEALKQAFRAFREQRGDPQIQRTFASLLFAGGVELPKPVAVDDGTYVRLRREDGAIREHLVFSDLPIDPSMQELSIEAAMSAGLLGKRVDETVERDAGHWAGHRWTIEEILPAMVFRARQILASFADNFPDEPFFVVQVSLKDEGGVSDWSQLIAALGERRERAMEVLRLYREQVLPLEFVATMLQVPVTDLMVAAKSDAAGGALLVEWSNADGQESSVHAAQASKGIVITRTALATAHRLGLLDQLASRYDVLAPTSLIWQLRMEIREAEEAVTRGRSTMSLAGPVPHIDDVAAGDPRLIEALDSAKASLAWLEEHAQKTPRPVRAIGDLSREEMRDRVGAPSYDAVILAESGAGALFADDLGLRRAAFLTNSRPPSFSSITLLEALSSEGVVLPDFRDRLLADLVLDGYAFVRPGMGLLEEGLRRMPGIGQEGLAKVFGPLGGPLITPLEAAAFVVQAVKAAIGAPIQLTPVDVVVEAGVRAMARRWHQAVAARLVRERAERELTLLPPGYLEAVVQSCKRLALESIPRL